MSEGITLTGVSQSDLELVGELTATGLNAEGVKNALVKTNQIDKKLELTYTRNMFDKENRVVGYYVGESGNESANATYDCSGYIEIKASTDYIGSSSMRFAVFYDINKELISSLANVSTFTTPATAVYVRVTVTAANIDTFQLEEGTVSTAYVEYGSYLDVELKEKLVQLKHLNILTVGKNLFNKNTVTMNKYMSNTASSLYDHDDYAVSDYIEVIEAEDYAITGYIRFATYFDEDYNVVAGGEGSGVSDPVITLPADVKYVKFTVRISELDSFQIEKGSTQTGYLEHTYLLQTSEAPIKLSETDVENEELFTFSPIQYVCDNKETNFYNENIIKRFDEYAGKNSLQFGMTDSRWRETSVSTKLYDASALAGNSYNLDIELLDKNFGLVDSGTSSVKVVDMTKTTAVTIANIGDSFSGRMTWANQILNETVPAQNLNFVGLRNANTAPIKCDAQGGWTLGSFFDINGGGAFSQFMHPVTGSYLYYGTTDFWIDANSASPTYNARDFDDAKVLFDSSTGYLLAPTTDAIMYDSTNSIYVNWDGSAWVEITEATYGGFAFNFGKYRTAWSIPTVDILHVLLGTNDFAGSPISNFSTVYNPFKANYEELIASVKADLPDCKVVMGIPVSSGKQGKYGTATTEKRKLGYWLLANQMNKDFSGREAEGIYLLDYHTQVDRVYGYTNSQDVPFDSYDGGINDDENLFKWDYVHLSDDGFEQMGLAYMAIIQELR